MTAMLNTLRYAKALKNAGVSASQAEAMAEALETEMVGQLASKADIQELAANTKADITEVKADIQELAANTKADITEVKADIRELATNTKADLRALEQRMTIRLGGLIAAGVAFLAALDKLL